MHRTIANRAASAVGCSSSQLGERQPLAFGPPTRRAPLLWRAHRPGNHATRAEEGRKGTAGTVVEKVEDFLDDCSDNIMEFCSLDKMGARRKSKRSLGEKEQEFLDALRSFYYDDTPIMSNEEFDMLKEELLWNGSKIAILSSTEQRFMEASMAYAAGKPILSDVEYDDLKKKLRLKNSKVVQQGPRCSIRSRRMYSDADVDYLKMTLLNLPAAILTLTALFSVDDLSGFKITRFVELPEPWGIIVVWGLVLPLTYLVSSSLTQLVARDALILKGPCPNCGKEQLQYFGDLFTVQGNRTEASLSCADCKAQLKINAERREIVIEQMPDVPKGGKAPAKSQKPMPA